MFSFGPEFPTQAITYLMSCLGKVFTRTLVISHFIIIYINISIKSKKHKEYQLTTYNMTSILWYEYHKWISTNQNRNIHLHTYLLKQCNKQHKEMRYSLYHSRLSKKAKRRYKVCKWWINHLGLTHRFHFPQSGYLPILQFMLPLNKKKNN